MDPANPLLLFALLTFGIVLLPGMDMAFVLASALRGGVRQGAAAVAGIVLGGVVHVLVGITGVALVLAVVPQAFNAVLLAGAMYLAWIGIGLVRHGAGPPPAAEAAATLGATLLRAMLTCLLNPKAYVFMLAVFPQFLDPDRDGVWLRAATLAAIIAATQVVVYGSVAVAAARAARHVGATPQRRYALGRAVGALLLVAAVGTVAGAWRHSTPVAHASAASSEAGGAEVSAHRFSPPSSQETTMSANTAARCCPIVELRQYTLHPGQRDTLVDLFETHFIESQEAVGMRVLAQFRDLDDPDRFVWLRGFADMPRRAAALQSFYSGPVWKHHRAAANATMVDSDDVLLLRPSGAHGGFDLGGLARPAKPAPWPSGAFVLASVQPMDAARQDALVAILDTQIAGLLRDGGATLLGAFVTETAPNTFPALPVREGEHVLVWLARFDDLAHHGRWQREGGASAAWKAAQDALRAGNGAPRTLRLQPTARSLVAGG